MPELLVEVLLMGLILLALVGAAELSQILWPAESGRQAASHDDSHVGGFL